MTDKPDKSLEEIIYEHYRLAWSKGEFPNGLEVTSKIVADAIRQWIRDELNKLEQYDYKYNEFFFKVSDVRKALGVEDEEKS